MKNILNVSKISLKPIFMSLAILFAVGVSVPHSFQKSVEAENSDYPSEVEEEEEVNSDDPEKPNYMYPAHHGLPKGSMRKDSDASYIEKKDDVQVNNNYGKVTDNYNEALNKVVETKEITEKDENPIVDFEEEKDMGNPSEIFIPENNEYYDEQAKKAGEKFHNTLFGEDEEDASESSNYLCPSIIKCPLI